MFNTAKVAHFYGFPSPQGQKSATSLPVFSVYSCFSRKLGRTESDVACVFIERVGLYGEKRRVSNRETQIRVLVCLHLSSIQALPKHVSICPFRGERPDEVDACQDYKDCDK